MFHREKTILQIGLLYILKHSTLSQSELIWMFFIIYDLHDATFAL